ncbi:MAG: chemotaxis protein CheC [Sarcina sp.]
MDYLRLNEMHLDAIKEIFNIGTGHGAKALSELLGKKIDINIPSLEIIDVEEIYEKIVVEEVIIGVLVRILGDAPGNILFTFSEDTATDIIETLVAENIDSIEESEIGKSVLCEIGNIIAASYMNAIADFTGIAMIASVPALSYDMTGAIISATFIESLEGSEKLLEVKTDLKILGNKLNTCLYYLPKEDSLIKILKSIGL